MKSTQVASQNDTRFEVRDAGNGTGWGLFAALPIRKGEFILEYVGNKIPTPVADDSKSRYLFEIDDDWTIDGPPDINLAGYVNHACKPNVEAEIEDGKINYYAMRDIEPGEELAIDYGKEYFDEFIKPVGCRCRAATHRK
jgi:SET domain-containing protein